MVLRSILVGLVMVSAAVSGNLIACFIFPILVIALAGHWNFSSWALTLITILSALQTVYGIISISLNENNEIIPARPVNATNVDLDDTILEWFALAGLPLTKGLAASIGATVAPGLLAFFTAIFRSALAEDRTGTIKIRRKKFLERKVIAEKRKQELEIERRNANAPPPQALQRGNSVIDSEINASASEISGKQSPVQHEAVLGKRNLLEPAPPDKDEEEQLSILLIVFSILACFCAAFSAPSLLVNTTYFVFAIVQALQVSFNVADHAFGRFNSVIVFFGTTVMLALCVFQNQYVLAKMTPPDFLGVPNWLTIGEVSLAKNWAQQFSIVFVTLVACSVKSQAVVIGQVLSETSELDSEPINTPVLGGDEVRPETNVGGMNHSKSSSNSSKEKSNSGLDRKLLRRVVDDDNVPPHLSQIPNAGDDGLDDDATPTSPSKRSGLQHVLRVAEGLGFIFDIIRQGFLLFKYLLFVLPTAPYTTVSITVIVYPSAVSILGLPVTIAALLASPRFVTFVMSCWLLLYTLAFCAQIGVGAMINRDESTSPVPKDVIRAFLFKTAPGDQQVEMVVNGLNFLLLCVALRERTLSVRTLVTEAPKAKFSPQEAYDILGPRRFEAISDFVDAIVSQSPQVDAEPIRVFVVGQAALFAREPLTALLMWARVVIANYNYFISIFVAFVAATYIESLDILHAGMILVVLIFAAMPMEWSRRLWFLFVIYISGLTGVILFSNFFTRFGAYDPSNVIPGQNAISYVILGVSPQQSVGETVTALIALFVTSAQVFVNYNEEYRPNEIIVSETFMLYEWNRFSGHEIVRAWRSRITLVAAGAILLGVPILSQRSLMALVFLLIFYTVSVITAYGFSLNVHLTAWRLTTLYSSLAVVMVILFQFKPISEAIERSVDAVFTQCVNITNPDCMGQLGLTESNTTVLATIIPWAIALVAATAHVDEISGSIEALKKSLAEEKLGQDDNDNADDEERKEDKVGATHDKEDGGENKEQNMMKSGEADAGNQRSVAFGSDASSKGKHELETIPDDQKKKPNASSAASNDGKNVKFHLNYKAMAATSSQSGSHYQHHVDDDDDEEEEEEEEQEEDEKQKQQHQGRKSHSTAVDDSALLDQTVDLKADINQLTSTQRRRRKSKMQGKKLDDRKIILSDPDQVVDEKEEERRKKQEEKEKSERKDTKATKGLFSTEGRALKARDLALESFPFVDQNALFTLTYLLDLVDRAIQITATIYKEYSRGLAQLSLVLVMAYDTTFLGLIFGVFLLFGWIGKAPMTYCILRSCVSYGYQFDFIPSDPVTVRGVSIIQLCGFSKELVVTGANVTGRLVITAFFANLVYDSMLRWKSQYTRLSRFISKMNRTCATEAAYELCVLTLLISLSYSADWLGGWVIAIFVLIVAVFLNREYFLSSFWTSSAIRLSYTSVFLGIHLVGLLGQNKVVEINDWTSYFGFGFERSSLISMGVVIIGFYSIAENRILFSDRLNALRIARKGHDTFTEWISSQSYEFDDAEEIMSFTRPTFDSVLPSFKEIVAAASAKHKRNRKDLVSNSNTKSGTLENVSAKHGGGALIRGKQSTVTLLGTGNKDQRIGTKTNHRMADEAKSLGQLDPPPPSADHRHFGNSKMPFTKSAPLLRNNNIKSNGVQARNVQQLPEDGEELRHARSTVHLGGQNDDDDDPNDGSDLRFTYTFDEFRAPSHNLMQTDEDVFGNINLQESRADFGNHRDDDDDDDDERGNVNNSNNKNALTRFEGKKQQQSPNDKKRASPKKDTHALDMTAVVDGDASQRSAMTTFVDVLKADIIFVSERGSDILAFAMGRMALMGFVLLAFSLSGLSILHVAFVWMGGFAITFNEKFNVIGHLFLFRFTLVIFIILPLFPLVANIPPVASWALSNARYSRILALEAQQQPQQFNYAMVIVLIVVIVQKRFMNSFARAEHLRETYSSQFQRRRRHARLKALQKSRLRLQWQKIYNLERHAERMLAQIRSMATSGGLIAAAAPTAGSPTGNQHLTNATETKKNKQAVEELADDGGTVDAAKRKFFAEFYHPPLDENDATWKEKLRKRVFDILDTLSEYCVHHSYRPAEVGSELRQYNRFQRVLRSTSQFLQARTFDMCSIALFLNALLSGTVVDCFMLVAWVVIGSTVYPRPPLKWIEYGQIYVLVAIGLKLLIICITTIAGASPESMRVLSAFFVRVNEQSRESGTFADLSDFVWDFIVFATLVLRKEITLHNGVFLALSEDAEETIRAEKRLKRQKIKEEKKRTLEMINRQRQEQGQALVTDMTTDGHWSSHSDSDSLSDDQKPQEVGAIVEARKKAKSNLAEIGNQNSVAIAGAAAKSGDNASSPAAAKKHHRHHHRDSAAKKERGLADQAKDFWSKYYACRKGIGKDSYLISVMFLALALLVFVFGYFPIAGGTGSLLSALQSDLLPGTLVVVICLMTVIFIIDRAAYLLVNIFVKSIVHTLFALVAIFGYVIYRDVHRDAAAAAYIFFAACWCYLLVSSSQVKEGFPRQRRHDPFTGFPESDIRTTLYEIYMAIPFLWEMRTCIDWTFTLTSLSFDEWFKVEDVIAMVYVRRVALQNRQPRLGEKVPMGTKAVGLVKVLLIAVLLLFPLMNFSTFNPNTVPNSITEFSIEIQFGQVSFIYRSATFSSTTIPNDYATWVNNVLPNIASSDITNPFKRTQLIELTSCSSELWTISPEGLKTLNSTLDTVIATNGTIPFLFTVTATREHTSGEAPLAITNPMSQNLDVTVAKAMKAALVSTTGESANVANMYNPIIFNQPTGLTEWTNVALDCRLTLRAPEYSPNLNTDVRYWCVQCPSIFTYGNIPNESFPEWNCITTGRGCGGQFDTEKHVNEHTNTSLYAIFISDDVAKSLGFLKGIGIIAFYTTFVLAVGNALRGMFSNTAHYAVFTEMAHPLHVHTLLQYLELARFARPPDLQTENKVYLQLIDLLRSPETLLRFTGRMLKLFKKNNEVRPEEQFTAALPDDGQQMDSSDDDTNITPEQQHATWEDEFNAPPSVVTVQTGELPVRLNRIPHEQDHENPDV